MGQGRREKLIVMLASSTLFAGGIAALSLSRGTGRTIVLWGCFAGLAGIAVRQTAIRMKKKEK